MTAFLIFIGAGTGGLLRYGVNRLMPVLPYNTFTVNVIGSFLMGVAMAYFMPKASSETVRLFLTTGILGGFTTFSAFSYDAYSLYLRGDLWQAVIYVLLSVIISLFALVLGVWIAKAVL
jgi:fluoride exporter